MRWPWISREAHDKLVGLLERRIEQLDAERTVLYDRLATIGLGGPLFTKVEPLDPPEEKETDDLVDPDEEYRRIQQQYKHRPSMLADALTRKAKRDFERARAGTSVKWIPDNSKRVTEALDKAEEEGRRQA